jgi:hypothetical protein
LQIVEKLPWAFKRFSEIGGALEFSVFEQAQWGEGAARAAMARAVPGWREESAKALNPREIDKQGLLGEWCDAATMSLIKVGSWTAEDGKVFTNPRLRDLKGIRLVSGGCSIPEVGAGGELAYAFSWTPYGLDAGPQEVQQLFEAITAFILPPDLDHKILDWGSSQLPQVSPYFESGMEWWGVFLFTIQVPALQRLTVIFGSATD